MLETQDSVAMLGYAGLGCTAGGTEPADWMNAVLRGRSLPLELYLGELAGALQRQFPPHLRQLPIKFGAAHSVVVSAFLNGEPRLYSIDIVLSADRKTHRFRYTRHVSGQVPSDPPRTPRIALAGSGASFLQRDVQWLRQLLKLVRACDAQRIEPHIVADFLAALSNRVSCGMADKSVGPRSIVVWRHRNGGARIGGGGHQFYNGIVREPDSGILPMLANGLDIQALVRAAMPFIEPQMSQLREHAPVKEIDRDGMNAALAKLPDQPDETLK
ncbi:hypothetical protein [Pelomonas sp. KK5]|uniref:hypothetical protein n=1 Tax=Pelomonas sp. KK5 TaxID=1855730 RepID=UPI00117CEB07|nr:hypothetical protein [Pelomonas sp. KK5]